MTPAAIAFVAGVSALGAVLGATVLPWWADRESRSAARSGVRTRVAGAGVTAVAFGVLAARVGVDALLPAFVAVMAVGTAISIVDLREKRIPNRMLLVAGPAVALLLAAGLLVRGEPARLLAVLAGAAAMFALYFLIALVVPAAMGMGDVKLAALLGGALGAVGLTGWLVGLLAAFLVGGVVALIALVAGRVGLRGSIPFGPWMIVGTLVGLTF
ncbi:MAG: prepilin peptidase [Pseudolysinimonas sp.]|uniref:prepilin peptidase n=1 Tax=Pseudolysinimonas sp. TaxID=2680009 RepID=UPI003C765353